ncbi:hypothetical protein EC973_003025 [Apophysomyces ossiformis]|uniref:Isopentenyl phosphate kinase n=1 Tax=Apophysomyces ossiformis TaxID=679940 RepID=A0A8H7ERT6_9FUNG|nr:hypothetical protein EC973_003025 [Apophysomyces ossiformis]
MTTVIVKLGGAAISDKQGICQLAPDSALDALLKQVHQAYQILASRGDKIILIHGAGSFAHPQAKQYRIKEGWALHDPEEVARQKAGFAHTRKCLLRLHLALMERLHALAIPVVSVSPFDHTELQDCDQSPSSCFDRVVQRVQQCLDLGFVPMLHGDTVLDQVRGCTVLSGDIVMYQLAMQLPKVTRCVFITDVDGIYNVDPKTDPTAQLIDHVQVAETQQQQEEEEVEEKQTPVIVKEGIEQGHVVDVTGGMQGKVKWAKRIILDAQRNELHVVICKSGSVESMHAVALDPLFHNDSIRVHPRMTVFTSAPP